MKVLVTAQWVHQYLAEFHDEFPTVEFVTGETEKELVAAAGDVEVAFGPLSAHVFGAAESLRWVQSASAGVEWMQNVPALADTEVIVTNTRGAHATTIAEHCFGMLIFLARGFDTLYESQKQKEWQRPLKKAGVGLVGMTMGIIGLGNIGRAIGQRAKAFEMKVIAVDVHDVPRPDYISSFWLLDGLPELMRQSDVVVVAVPITPETQGMIGPNELAQMKPGSFLMVMSRGGIVHEPTVAGMLREGQLAGAGLDVTAIEPLPADSELWTAPNIFITPHSSPSSQQTRANVAHIMKDNLKRYLADQPLTNIVDKKLGY
jgi:phosphoglycerate dehydrogenase-like enzyme